MLRLLLLCTVLLQIAGCATAQTKPAANDRWFNTLVAHWTDYATPEYLAFLEESKPEIAQVGFYGVTFYSLIHTPFYKGYPAHMPVQGTTEGQAWFANLNAEVHKRGSRVIGHFNTTFIFGDLEKKTGFFEWYEKGWDVATFGPKPTEDAREMMQVDKDGKPITTNSYKIGGWPEYHGCLNNPKWRACLKPMIKSAIERGVDGLVANYFYRRDCMCEYCVSGFRAYLKEKYTTAELQAMGIENIDTHKFEAIPSWHNPKETNAYKMAALTWTQIALKRDFDDVFIDYGRGQKPGLIVGQWNHLGNFNQINGDERSAMPGDLWGKDEDYLWYSTGNAASQTDLAKGDLGDGTLQLRFIRGAFGPNKSFLLGKYEQARVRVSVAEGVANGGAGMGFYAPFKEPIGRAAFKQYFGFLRTNREYYVGANPAGELLLLYPRSAVHKGDVAPVDRFRVIGKQLLKDGFAFDVLPDDLLTADSLKRYSAVAVCDESALSPIAKQALATFTGARLAMPTGELPPDITAWNVKLASVSRREGSTRVLLSVMAQPDKKRVMVHLVNYDREEPEAKNFRGRGPQDEKPLPVENVTVHLQIPAKQKIKKVRLLSCDDSSETVLKWKTKGATATFVVPKMLVYSVAVVEFR